MVDTETERQQQIAQLITQHEYAKAVTFCKDQKEAVEKMALVPGPDKRKYQQIFTLNSKWGQFGK